jgi:hypothetical protein
MKILEQLDLKSGGRVEVCEDHIAQLSPQVETDVLVVSAFRDDYTPTTGSVVGALDRRGISVEELAEHKYGTSGNQKEPAATQLPPLCR